MSNRCPLRGRSNAQLEAARPVAAYSLFIRTAGLAFACVGFAAAWAFFACFVIFVGNLPRRSAPWLDPSIDASGGGPTPPLVAVIVDLALMALFAMQHSGMARHGFKAWITRFVPATLERSLYVHAACATGFLLVFLWQPIPIVVWDVDNGALRTALWAGFSMGWLVLMIAALSIDVTQLLGVKQALALYKRCRAPDLRLKTDWLYRWLRHPMYVGVLLGIWCAPSMTAGHLLLAAGMTLYVAFGMRFEERDLELRYGIAYCVWRDTTLRPGIWARAVAPAWQVNCERASSRGWS
jgi:protein-S-isoprenylcysteine O-methyltransferase Ste14